MNQKLLIILLCFIISTEIVAAQNLAYSLELSYTNGSIKETNLFLINSPNSVTEDVGGEYEARLYSYNGDLLFKTGFNFNVERTYEADPSWFDAEGNQIVFKNETSPPAKYITKVIFLPYNKNAKEIKIFRYDELKLSVDVSKFSACNNNDICDNKETNELCPEECLCGNGVCDKGETYSTCTPDCPHESTRGMGFWQRIWYLFVSLFGRVFNT